MGAIESKKPSNSAKHFRTGVLTLASMVLISNACISIWLLSNRAPSTVAFDMKGTLDQFMEQSANRSLSDSQSANLVSRFTQALEESLAQYQKDKNVIILVSPSVVSAVPDITRDIQHEISQRMRSQSGSKYEEGE